MTFVNVYICVIRSNYEIFQHLMKFFYSFFLVKSKTNCYHLKINCYKDILYKTHNNLQKISTEDKRKVQKRIIAYY